MELVADDERIARLLAFDSCTVSDALDRLGLPGAVSGLSPILPGRRIAGPVLTVRLEAGAPPRGAPVRHLGAAAIDEAKKGHVIVVSQRAGVDAGAWGGLLSRAAMLKGLAGVIVDGPLRDVDEAREMGLSVFSRTFTPFTARGRVHEAESGGPLSLSPTLTVEQGYVVLADGSGCVFIKPTDIDRVLEAAEAIAARESAMVADLALGKSVSAVMGAQYEHMLKEPEGG